MTNSNLKTFDNFYADLAQSAYHGRPIRFPYESQLEDNKKILDNGGSLEFDFSQAVVYEKEITPGGKNLPHNGKVYLQPDPDLHTVEETMDLQVPNPNGGYHKETYVINHYQKGLLTDEKAGFNAYFLTDTPTLGKDTKQTYFSIRGSDGMSLANLNDWVDNDAQFAINNIHIPQAKLATKGMKAKIAEMKEKAPDAKMDITGHSLGTMVSAQGVAGLSDQELEKIGKVVLFDGPDTTKSLKKMGLSDEKIKKISEKIEYYVNPFDMVSMLNREHTITHLPGDPNEPLKKPVGKVNIVVPLYYTQSFDSESSHDFGVFQSDGKGSFLTASEDYHPELLRAGEKLARLVHRTIEGLRTLGVNESLAMSTLLSIMMGDTIARVDAGVDIYNQFNKEYKEIIETAKKESKQWDQEAISRYQNQLKSGNLTGEKRILVRAQLLQTAAQLAIFDIEEKVKNVETLLSNAKEDVLNIVNDTNREASQLASYLTASEVSDLLADFNTTLFWNDGIEESTKKSASSFLTKIEQLGMTLVRASSTFETVDTKLAEDFNKLLKDVQNTWRNKNSANN
ncbi:cutinase family protein [Streptococcus gordonii]|uniref:cutinase family protein n=1 Tax=Streptococcus gordonii TaxID=1302 RepID=UPI001CBD3C1E|nr:cutinase family protein [Streptococcus gordonii]MBZ2148827.1 cutinase family protein [Streptococcus gordonii]MCG4821803.1 cutinase family protein [Streptococcus gordonii]MCG4847161.1 cutinase family protein [Streptococcus gordonii]MDE8686579.1 cutinase family protein [Streptococcus gordonii]